MHKELVAPLSLGLALATASTPASAAPDRLAQPVTNLSPPTRVTFGEATNTNAPATYSVRLTSHPLKADQATILAEQDAFIQRHQQDGIRVVGRVRHVLNAVFIEVSDDALSAVAGDPMVQRVTPVANYELDLSDTVPYIGAAAVQATGVDGSDGAGVTVAVLDSGIDYLHADLGGSGSVAEYDANDPDVIEAGTFPTAKVIGGFDFVGETWPNGPVVVDPDPLDFEGHGTNVADIIAGRLGVAPAAELYAVKVCSAVASSCNGVALLQGMDFVADPNGDGDTSDHVDIVNMSLGSIYGQAFDDDLAAAVEIATQIGIVTVASAGNSADVPYKTGTPAGAASAISVAQTAVPSAIQEFMEITNPALGLVPAVFQPWSVPLTGVISGPVTYGDGAGGNLNGCAPFTTALTGIVLVDRGACAFSQKIANIGAAGGELGIIGLIAPGAPFPGAFGGGTVTIPGFMIDQAASNFLKTGVEVSFDPQNGQSLAGSMVSSSARGPRLGDSFLKPEIGAPGASLSADATTGTGRRIFGGTSGAAPMVSGSAALILSVNGGYIPQMVKQKLMNGADPMIARDFTGVAAEVSRIGAGEVNAWNAFNAGGRFYEESGLSALSMGYQAISKRQTEFTKTVRVYNDMPYARVFDIESTFRFADDASSGAIEIFHPATVSVDAFDSVRFTVTFLVNGENLPTSSMNSAAEGNNPAALTATEFGGHIFASDARESFTMPWHIIPRKSADVSVTQLYMNSGTGSVDVSNTGVGPAHNAAFNLVAVSPNIPEGAAGAQSPTPDIKAVGVRTTPVPAGFCGDAASFLIEFAFNTWEPQTLLLPVILDASIDLDNDGTPEYIARNGDFDFYFGGGSVDGRSVSAAFDLVNGGAGVFFFAEHATNTRNTVITYCAEQLGMSSADLGTKEITVSFSAIDFWFGGPGDALPPVRFTVGGGYAGTVADAAPGATEVMNVVNNGGVGPDIGLMLFTNGDRGAGNRGGATEDSETVFVIPDHVMFDFPEGF